MKANNPSIDKIISSLKERAKELSCLFRIEEILNSHTAMPDEVFNSIIEAIPQGWQFSDVCVCKITTEGKEYKSENFSESKWAIKSSILIEDFPVGFLDVYYTEEKPPADEGPFLKEERKLLDAVTDRIGHYIFHNRLRNVYEEMNGVEKPNSEEEQKPEWRVAIDILRQTDKLLYATISRKMLNYLCCCGIEEAQSLIQTEKTTGKNAKALAAENIPMERRELKGVARQVYNVANNFMSDNEILNKIQKWIQEDKSKFLVRVIEDTMAPLEEIADALQKYNARLPEYEGLPASSEKGLRISLIRRLFSESLDFINIAKNYVSLEDFVYLIQKMIFTKRSIGKIGGKAVGLYIAHKILKTNEEQKELFKNIKIPKTYYIASDGVIEFIHYNNLEEIVEQKYKDKDQIRQEYPSIIQLFKNSDFPEEIEKALHLVIDDVGEVPIIVRSSSLLEDRLGSAFSGKYKSLFLANQGTKQERLDALLDAVSEVYASTFSPDPIEYRNEKGLLDYREEMGVMIQEVVGNKIGKYFFPLYAGVAFSNNEFRWSPRIKRDDGLIRLVTGLGTRAVDRVSDDYPILIAPGRPELKVNITAEDNIRYSPHKIDVINLETNTFETLDVKQLFTEYGDDIPKLDHIASVAEYDRLKDLSFIELDAEKDNLVVTFNKLTKSTDFIPKLKAILNLLKDKLQTPVDIEFASDGTNFYLLQCRPQSYSGESQPSPIPKDVPKDEIIFSANKYISNGKVPDISHIVYVSPEKYGEITNHNELLSVGIAVSKLNKILPRRQFILMGPGRWGSRGDIKLGVNVTYSDINNTAMLIEIARKKGNYLPDLSFGTHFFQDLVESQIRYLPLYPDEKGNIFNEKFFEISENIIEDILPEFAHLKAVIKVIDVEKSSNGRTLKVLMNADLDEAIAVLGMQAATEKGSYGFSEQTETKSEDHWKWRFRMVEKIAELLDTKKFGVKAFYIIGSTKNGTAGPKSDIDLLVHFDGNEQQRSLLITWLDGWSVSLSETNYLRTGYKTDGLLDVQLITDDDIKNKQSYASKIGAVTDAAKQIPLKKG